MRVHVFQHVPFEDLGAIEPWLAEHDARVEWTRFFEEPRLPDIDAFEWLIVLGGPMSVHDVDHHPWLSAERRAIAAALEAGRTVLGICLGAQLLARASGARVVPNEEREVGWFPIERVAARDAHPLAGALPARADAFHWHGETFELPGGAVHLARSAGCEAQAFALGPRALGLQFHVEVTPAGVGRLAEHCPDDLRPGRWVQTRAAMLADPRRFAVAHRILAGLLDGLLAAA
jgi:GMP synthase-like glutamine amidotransferase